MPGTYRSGRHRKPTAVKRLQGAEIRGGEDEPVYDVGLPPCPPHVREDPQAAAAWDTIAAVLQGAGVLTVAHGESLAMLAHATADYERVRAALKTMGYQQLVVEEIRNDKGVLLRRRVRENPLLRRSERISLLVGRLLGEFGLTPITNPKVRARGGGRASGPHDAFEVLLGGKHGAAR